MMDKPNSPIVIFALLLSPCETATVHFYQKIGEVFHPISNFEMHRKTIGDIIALADTIYYELKEVKPCTDLAAQGKPC